MNLRQYILLFISFFTLFVAKADGIAEINVHVTDNVTGEPIEFAVVSFNQPERHINIGGLTDANGIYCANLHPGIWTLKVSSAGFKIQERTMTVSKKALIFVSLNLMLPTFLILKSSDLRSFFYTTTLRTYRN